MGLSRLNRPSSMRVVDFVRTLGLTPSFPLSQGRERGPGGEGHHFEPALVPSYRTPRAASLVTIRSLTPAQWGRWGEHEREGTVTMKHLAERLHRHTLEHITRGFENRQMLAVVK